MDKDKHMIVWYCFMVKIMKSEKILYGVTQPCHIKIMSSAVMLKGPHIRKGFYPKFKKYQDWVSKSLDLKIIPLTDPIFENFLSLNLKTFTEKTFWCYRQITFIDIFVFFQFRKRKKDIYNSVVKTVLESPFWWFADAGCEATGLGTALLNWPPFSTAAGASTPFLNPKTFFNSVRNCSDMAQ